MKLNKFGRSVVMGILAGMLYGSWAVYANWNHEITHVVVSAGTQFLLSFCSTSFLTLMIELVLAQSRSPGNLVVVAVGPHTGMVLLFLTAHCIVKTPNVLKTIAPSAMIGLVFSILYVVTHRRAPEDERAPAGLGTLADPRVRDVAPAP